MKRAKDDLTLRYIDGRIDRLFKRFNELEDLIYKWKREDAEEIDKLKQTQNSSKEKGGSA